MEGPDRALARNEIPRVRNGAPSGPVMERAPDPAAGEVGANSEFRIPNLLRGLPVKCQTQIIH